MKNQNLEFGTRNSDIGTRILVNPLFESYKLFFDGKEEDLSRVPSNLLKPLLHWFSFNKENIDFCQVLNRQFKYIPSDMLKYILYYKIDVENRFQKRFKTVYDAKFDFLKDYLMKYFDWSEREFFFEKKLIDEMIKNDDIKNLFHEVFGFSESECKKLNIKYETLSKKRKDTGSISLFSFVKKEK